jgi:hypothetical protein
LYYCVIASMGSRKGWKVGTKKYILSTSLFVYYIFNNILTIADRLSVNELGEECRISSRVFIPIFCVRKMESEVIGGEICDDKIWVVFQPSGLQIKGVTNHRTLE